MFVGEIKEFILLLKFSFINAVSEAADNQSPTTHQDQTLDESKETSAKQVFHKLLRELLQNVYSVNNRTDLSVQHRKSSTETASITSQQHGRDVVHSSIQQYVNVILPGQLERRTDSKTHVLERMNVLLKQLQNDLLLNNDVNKSNQSLRPSSQFQCHKSINSIVIQSTPGCCPDLIGLTLVKKDQYSSDQTASTISDVFKSNISVLISCLDFDSSHLTISENFHYSIQSFPDKCACISHLLSTENQIISFVTSATAGKLVVPLIHSHICIRYIYIYQKPDVHLDSSWMRDFGKIRGVWSSVDQMKEQMILDIQSCTTRSSRWSRCQEIFVELWRQSSSKSSLNTKLLSEEMRHVDVAVPNIVVLFCNAYRPFHLSHDVIKINEFDDIKHCFNSAQSGMMSSIFLIVCISSIDFFEEVHLLMKLDSVHATYIFSNNDILKELQTMLTDDAMKLSGIFSDYNDIVLQLTKDICFYRQIPFHIPKITTLRPDVNSIEQLNQQEIDFVRFQLFVDILPRISLITDSSSELRICVSTDSTNSLFYHLINNSIFGQVINELFNQCDLLTLLEASSLLGHTDQRLATLALDSEAFPITVYRVQLVGKENLEMMRHNINSLFTIHTFTLFSGSFSSVVDICRQSMNNGLIVVLLEIEVSENTTLVKIDSDRFAFRLGSVFRILSIDQMPDGIWHVQLELIDCAINQIHEQLQFDIDVRDIWLTFGNYMTALKQFDDAKIYYEYLLRNISPEDSCRSSIYNNIGLMYSAMNNEEEALRFFEQASQAFIEDVPTKIEENNSYSFKQQSIPDSEFHQATLYGKIAEKYDRQEDYAKALDYYRKALEAAPDLTTNRFYQTAIKRTRKKLSVS